MRPTFLGFETQKRTLQIAQKSLDIVGNNISNMNNVGYTRQRVDTYAMYVTGNCSLRWSSATNNLSLTGQGVNASGVDQLRDMYIDKRYRENIAIEAETEKNIEILSYVEDALDNFETDGLQYFTQQFFNALQDYSEETPDSTDVATICCTTAVNLCRSLNDYHDQLCYIEDTYVAELRDNVDYVNNLFVKINDANDKIVRELLHYNEGYGPNELYDELNLYIDELATYGNIFVKQEANGAYSVTMGGVKVVDGEKFKYNRVIMKDYYESNSAKLFFESGEDLNLSAGYLKSFIDMLNGNGVYATGAQNSSYGIAYFKSALDVYARTLAETFNKANNTPEDPARAMFVTNDGSEVFGAGNIEVAPGWIDDPTMIGQVRRWNEQQAIYEYGYDESVDEINGAVTLLNTNVLTLISQFKQDLKFGDAHDFEGDIYDYIAFMSNRLGQTISYDKSRYDAAVVAVDTLLDARDDVSAVQIDEEGINMLNYQKWYSASSRMVTTLDDLLDRLINNTGRCGL